MWSILQHMLLFRHILYMSRELSLSVCNYFAPLLFCSPLHSIMARREWFRTIIILWVFRLCGILFPYICFLWYICQLGQILPALWSCVSCNLCLSNAPTRVAAIVSQVLLYLYLHYSLHQQQVSFGYILTIYPFYK